MLYYGGFFGENLIGLYDDSTNYFSIVDMKKITQLLDTGYQIQGIVRNSQTGTLNILDTCSCAKYSIVNYTLVVNDTMKFGKLPTSFICEYKGLRIEINRNRNKRNINYKEGHIFNSAKNPVPIDECMLIVREFLGMLSSDKYLIHWRLSLYVRNTQYLDLNKALQIIPRRIGTFVVNWDIELYLTEPLLKWVKYDCSDADKLVTRLAGNNPYDTSVDIEILYVDMANEIKLCNLDNIESFIDRYMVQNGLVFINSLSAIQYIQERYDNTDRQLIYLGDYSKNDIKNVLTHQAKYMLMSTTMKNKVTYFVNVKEKSAF